MHDVGRRRGREAQRRTRVGGAEKGRCTDQDGHGHQAENPQSHRDSASGEGSWGQFGYLLEMVTRFTVDGTIPPCVDLDKTQ
ncbi:hypothetical protein GCM10009547_18900 [Sporichthya brevicatena]|uniref:Uncharacterized protein n=1 Tax=Sporichthya brevicatena TaxID=171442 RepID=A0ABP3RTV6_9ACTN